MENLLILDDQSTHYYLIDTFRGWLMVDAGMPGSFPRFTNLFKRKDIDPARIRFLLFTHHDPDHAGIIQDLKEYTGARLLIYEKQIPFLPALRALYLTKGGYTPIRVEPGDLVLTSDNHALLASLGIAGQVIETPGHTDDSISLLMDSGTAFIGDLTPPGGFDPLADPVTLASWQRLVDAGAKEFYHAHIGQIPLQRVQAVLRAD